MSNARCNRRPLPRLRRYFPRKRGKIRTVAAALSALALIAPVPLAHAAAPSPPSLSAPDAALVARTVAYLQSLATAKGRFVQTDARGQVTQGTFWLQRPGRARFEYDPPSGLVIASDGFKVSVVDRRLKTIQSYPLGLTPLSLFLARDIRLDKGVAVTGVDRGQTGFSIHARDARKKTQGEIVLTFTAAPLALTGWTITDAQGRAVRVSLMDFGPASPREHGFFELADPARTAAAPG